MSTQTYKPDHYFERPAEIELIRQMVSGRPAIKPPPREEPVYSYDKDAFIIKPAGAWLDEANKSPEAKMLFDCFWFEGELCILFADTNVGKSILAVQIGDSISRQQPVNGFRLTAAAQTVLYFDFELSDKQFEARYHHAQLGNYAFNNKRFFRAVANPAANKMKKFKTYEEYLNNELENALTVTGAKVLIIDNLTCLRFNNYSAKGAISLIRNLQMLQAKYKLSVLVLAHTPKRNPVKPIGRNCLQGSKMLINFCDSAFAIGESHTMSGRRYLKQVKQRSTHETYGAGNVCLCNITKPGNFLQLEFTGYGHEAAHLLNYTEQQRKSTETRVAELHSQNLSIRQIAERLNIANSTAFRMVKKLGKENK